MPPDALQLGGLLKRELTTHSLALTVAGELQKCRFAER
jgi:hypothetical protein